MYKSIAALVALMSLTGCTTLSAEPVPSKATITSVKVIDHDPGGNVATRIKEIEGLIKNGTKVEIRGNCWSSCTLYTKLIETDQFCVYPSASLHFHAPWIRDQKTGENLGLAAPAYQAWFLMQYPNHIHMIIASTGGLTKEWLHLSGPMLKHVAPYCGEKQHD
jgi:hypothetical protein